MTDRVTEFCGKSDSHDYDLFLAINDIDHSKTKLKIFQDGNKLTGEYYIRLRGDVDFPSRLKEIYVRQ